MGFYYEFFKLIYESVAKIHKVVFEKLRVAIQSFGFLRRTSVDCLSRRRKIDNFVANKLRIFVNLSLLLNNVMSSRISLNGALVKVLAHKKEVAIVSFSAPMDFR